MTTATLADDPQGFVEELPKQGKFVIGDDGIAYYEPGEEEGKELNAYMLSEILQAEKDHSGFRERIAKNERAYEAIPDAVSGEKPMIVLPIIRRDCDQIASWFVNTIMRPHPVFSFDPCFPATYQVPVQTGNPLMPATMLDTTAEQVANNLEHAIEYLVRERMKFRRLVETVISETVRGRGPAIVKVVFDQKFHNQVVKDFQAGAFNMALDAGTKVVKREDGEPVKAYAIPTENFLMPADEEVPLTARWVAESTPLNNTALKRELKKKQSLIRTGWDDMLSQTTDTQSAHSKDMKATVDGRANLVPKGKHDVREVWFEYHVEASYEPEKLLGLFHVTAGRFIWITQNPYHHKRNPYVAFFQKKRPFRFSGSSTAEELAPIQNLASQLLHLMLQSAVLANTVVFAADPETEAFDWIKESGDVENGDLIPGKPEDVQPLHLGRDLRTMMPEVQFLLDLGRSVSGNSQYDEGSYIPGRTSPNTVDMIMKSGQQVPLAQLLSFADSFCEVIWLWLKTYKQYKPFGEVFYVMDEEARELVEIPFRLPDEEALDNFRISLTAADELAAQETTPEMLTMIANLLDQDAEQIAKVLGPLVSMDTPDSLMPLLERMISRKQDIIDILISQSRVDSKDFTVTREMLRSVEEEKRLIKEQLQAQQAAMAAAGAQPGAPPAPPQGGQPNGAQAVPPGQ